MSNPIRAILVSMRYLPLCVAAGLGIVVVAASAEARSPCTPRNCPTFQMSFEDWQTPRFSKMRAGGPCRIETAGDGPRLVIEFGSVDAIPRGGINFGVTPEPRKKPVLQPMTISIEAGAAHNVRSLRIDAGRRIPMVAPSSDADGSGLSVTLALDSRDERAFVRAFRRGAKIMGIIYQSHISSLLFPL